VLLAAAAFGNALTGEFLYDDLPYIVENPQVQQPTLARIFAQPLTERRELGLYRPIPLLTYALQAGGRGEEAPSWPFHALNVGLHAAVTLLVLALALRLGTTRAVALVAAALFAVHPVHVEPVDWIVGRAELLAALFGLAYVVLSLDAGGRPSPRRRLAAFACFACACFSKESSFALPAVVVAVDFARGRRPRFVELLRRYAPEALLLAAVALLRVEIIGHFGPSLSLGPYGRRSWLERLPIAANLLGAYFRRCIVPSPPRIFFHRSEFSGWQVDPLIGLALLAAAFLLFRRERTPRAALVAFPVALLTVLNLVPIQETLAERFLYLPSAFACVALGALIAKPLERELAARGRASLSILPPLAVVAALLGCCWYWNPVFDDALSLWRHNSALAPELPFPHYQAAYFLNQKQVWTARRAGETGALEEYELALARNDVLLARNEEGMPRDQLIRSYLSLGDIYVERLPLERRDPVKARSYLEKAIEVGKATDSKVDPELGKALLLSAHFHRELGIAKQEAETYLRAALELELSGELKAAVSEDLERLKKE
jgi:protein O-mannosyl-transferase